MRAFLFRTGVFSVEIIFSVIVYFIKKNNNNNNRLWPVNQPQEKKDINKKIMTKNKCMLTKAITISIIFSFMLFNCLRDYLRMMNDTTHLLTFSQNDIRACHQHVAFLQCLQTSILERVTAFKQDQCGGRSTFFPLLLDKNIKSQTTSTASHTNCFVYLLSSKVIRNDNTRNQN